MDSTISSEVTSFTMASTDNSSKVNGNLCKAIINRQKERKIASEVQNDEGLRHQQNNRVLAAHKTVDFIMNRDHNIKPRAKKDYRSKVDDEEEMTKLMGKISRGVCDWRKIFNDSFPIVPIIITNIAETVPYGKQVRFHGNQNKSGYEAQILCNVKYTGHIAGTSRRNQPVFEGTNLNPKNLKEKLKELSRGKHILFYIPGKFMSWINFILCFVLCLIILFSSHFNF